MADEYISSVDRMLGASQVYNAVFTDKKDNGNVKPSDFLNLMIAQMRNQDFLNPMDDTQFVTQMAQFTTMQQMMELAEWSKSSYAMTLVGKTVTASRFNVAGGLDTITGVVERVSFVDNEYVLYIDDGKGGEKQRYNLSQIMEVHNGPVQSAKANETDKAEEEEKTEQTEKTEKTEQAKEDKAPAAVPFDPAAYRVVAGEPTEDAAVVFWSVPADAGEAARLRYTVYYSEEGPFDTLADVEAGTVSGQINRADIQVDAIVGLEPGTDYYINVVVTDENGVKAVYKPALVTTKTLSAGELPPLLEEVEPEEDEPETDEIPAGEEAEPVDDLPEPEDPEYDGVYGADEDSV